MQSVPVNFSEGKITHSTKIYNLPLCANIIRWLWHKDICKEWRGTRKTNINNSNNNNTGRLWLNHRGLCLPHLNLCYGQREISELFKQGNKLDGQVFEMKLLPQLGVNGQKMRMKVKSPTPRCPCWRGATDALFCPLLDLGSVPWAVWGSQGHHEQKRKRFIRKSGDPGKKLIPAVTVQPSMPKVSPDFQPISSFLEIRGSFLPKTHNWHHSLDVQWIPSCTGATMPCVMWGRWKFPPSLLGSCAWLNN